jgi:hypothetical protein
MWPCHTKILIWPKFADWTTAKCSEDTDLANYMDEKPKLAQIIGSKFNIHKCKSSFPYSSFSTLPPLPSENSFHPSNYKPHKFFIIS